MKLQSVEQCLHSVLLRNDEGLVVRIEAWAPRILRISCTCGRFPEENTGLPLVIGKPENVPVTVTENDREVTVTTEGAGISVRKATFGITLFRSGKSVCRLSPWGMQLRDTVITSPHYVTDPDEYEKLKQVSVGERPGYRFRLSFDFADGEQIYGLGQSVSGVLDRRMADVPLYQNNNTAPNPMFTSSLGYGVFVNASCWSGFRRDEYGTTFCADAVDFGDWFFLASENIDGAIRLFRSLTGEAPMMPKWLFGFAQSRERYHTQKELLDVVHEYRARRIPLDLIVQDYYYWPPETWSDKSFDETRYPDPTGMCRDVHDHHAHLMISVWPNTRGGACYEELAAKNRLAAIGGIYGEGGIYNVFDDAACDTYWGQLERGIFRHGIDAWWCDCSEPFEPRYGDFLEPEEQKAASMAEYGKWFDLSRINLFSFLHCRNVYEHQRKVTENKRVVILTRSGYAGQQRYSGMVWSGDIPGTFEEMRRQVAEGLSFCASGLPYWTNDIGGFRPFRGEHSYDAATPYTRPEDRGYHELYTRWFAYAVFLPVFRSHGTGMAREVWQFGEPGGMFYDAQVKFISLRYSLLPYIYSTAWQVTKNAETFIRLLAFDFAGDPEALAQGADSYLFGRSLLVSPVTKPMYFEGADTPLCDVPREKDVYLPAGTDWYDYFTGERFCGGQTVTVETPIDKIPLFARAGAVIPTTAVMQYVDEVPDAPYTVTVYPGDDGHFTVYEDAGDGYGYERGEHAEYDLDWCDASRTLAVSARRGSFPGMCRERQLLIRVCGGESRTVVYRGDPLCVSF